MIKKTELELKVGFFVALGLALLMIAIVLMGGGSSFFSSNIRYKTQFADAGGLLSGAKVVLNGIRIGFVETLELNDESRSVEIQFVVESRYRDWIRSDSTVDILTQGVLGDKFIAVSMGSPDSPAMDPNSLIPVRQSKGLDDFLSSGDNLMTTLNSVAVSLDRILRAFEEQNRADRFFDGISKTSKNLAEATDKFNRSFNSDHFQSSIQHINSILEKIDRGTGTIGALINDPGVYDDAKSLLAGANRSRVVRNLVRQTVKDGEEDRNQK